MAFTTLAERFEQRSREIYNKFSPSSDQLVVVKPDTDGVFGSRSRIKNDTRAVPTVSVLRDTSRVSKFLASPEGRLFIGQQSLLQTGNTFATTKIYNPLSPIANTVPFLHTRRHIPKAGAIAGILQTSTVTTQENRFSANNNIVSKLGSSLVAQLRGVGNTFSPIVPQQLNNSRPEYKVFGTGFNSAFPETGPRLYPAQPLSQRGVVNREALVSVGQIKRFITNRAREATAIAAVSFIRRQIPRRIRNIVPVITPTYNAPENASGNVLTFTDKALQFKENFYKDKRSASRFNSKYFAERIIQEYSEASIAPSAATSGSTTLSDNYNVAPFLVSTDSNTVNYSNIIREQPEKSDIIKFVFTDAAGQNPVHFRALISSIKESVKPEFNEQRYVGRTERFVTYGGVKRGLGLSFNIVAFSQEEADGMWTKVNYLTGLAFPKGVTNGFMVPPLFKMTIGGLYSNQPCYIETLDYDFLDESITFDVNREVPFAINVNMQLSILEKRSKFYDSPFYKITEDASKTALERQRFTDIISQRSNQA